ncbi:MAG: acyl-CoA dehydrogenase [Candidatus Binatia bacterium]|nr:MAG: acyl-CoA dehydrogenase [Candidatus Binatia bacterium]
MDFSLTEEQELLRRTAREFLAAECPPAFVRRLASEEDGFSSSFHRGISALGWPGLVVPEAYGGQGLGFLEAALLLEEFGRAAAPGYFAPSYVLAAAALRSASPRLARSWLPRLATGEAIGTVALFEESELLDARGVTGRARRTRGGFVLRGKKLFVPYARVADFFLAPFRLGSGIPLFFVPKETPGIRIEELSSYDLTRRLYEVHFHDVRVPEEHALFPKASPWSTFDGLLLLGALAVSADSLGGAESMLERSVEYSKVRQQFGRPIGSFQALKHMAAEMWVEIEFSRPLVWYAAHLCDTQPRRASVAVSMAKARTSEVFSSVADRAVQMHGGIGFTWEHDLHFWYKRAMANRAAYGDPAFHRERVVSEGLEGRRHASP